MKDGTRNVLLIGAGFLFGTAGLKALKSQPAHKCYVHTVAAGLRAKQGYEKIVEEAHAEVDDIVADAKYMNETRDSAKEE